MFQNPNRIIPIFRSLLNLSAAAAHQFNNEPSVAIVDAFGALWTRNADAAQVAPTTGGTTNFSIFSTPVAATQATATKGSAGAGKKNVLTTLAFQTNAVAAQAQQTVVVRDGASGVGTIIWSMYFGAFAVGLSGVFSISGLNLVGSNATAMTIEFTAAPAATNFNSITGTGYVAG